MKSAHTALAVVVLAVALTATPDFAAADHPYKVRVSNYYAPPPVVVQPVPYPVPAASYYAPAPYYAPREPVPAVVYTTPSYSFYQPPRVGVYVPPTPYASTTTTYQKGLLLHRTYSNTTTYYTPGYFRY